MIEIEIQYSATNCQIKRTKKSTLLITTLKYKRKTIFVQIVTNDKKTLREPDSDDGTGITQRH
jgi:hypothetical protein